MGVFFLLFWGNNKKIAFLTREYAWWVVFFMKGGK